MKFVTDTIVSVNLIDEKTQNPVPSIGSVSWNYTITDTGAINITIDASVSSELPYKKRYISAELDSKMQEKTIEKPFENVQFVFDQLDSKVTHYSLMVQFKLISETVERDVDNVTLATINIRQNNGHNRLLNDSFLLLFLTLFIFCNIAW
jgi:hypothetical protein